MEPYAESVKSPPSPSAVTVFVEKEYDDPAQQQQDGVDLEDKKQAGDQSDSDDESMTSSDSLHRSYTTPTNMTTTAAATATKVDRHGFIIGHRLHDKVSSLPNPAHTTVIGQRRERKWLHMFQNWDAFVRHSPDRLRRRCYKGIPQAVRSLAWQHLCGAHKLKEANPGVYNELLERTTSSDNVDEGTKRWSHTIKRDVPRTFRHHCMFKEDEGQGAEDLYQVLLVFSAYSTNIGYNQALAPLAAVLLMHMPPDECFWVLVSVCKYFVPGYYGDKMEAMRLDGLIFDRLLRKYLPHVYKHMCANNIDPLMYIVEWFVCVYARCLPFQTVLRAWDMFFCEGVKSLFKIGLAILKLVFPDTGSLEGLDDFQTTQILLDLPKEVTIDSVLIPEAIGFDIKEREFQKHHQEIYRENPELSLTRYYSTTVKID